MKKTTLAGLVVGALLGLVLGVTASALAGETSVTEVWRNGLVSISQQLEYHASAVAMDDFNNLFVGGQVQLVRDTVQRFPFVAKFDQNGLKLWEYWPRTYLNVSITEGLTSDGRGGVYAAFRSPAGGIQLVWLGNRGIGTGIGAQNDLEYASDYWTFTSQPLNSVNLTADGSNGFYLTGLLPQSTNVGVPGKISVARYDADGVMVWRTNLFDCFLGPAGLERAVRVHSNSVFVCGRLGSELVSRLARVGGDGRVHWVADSGVQAMWSRVEVLQNETIAVAGEYNYQIFSGQGTQLVSHGGFGFCGLARQSSDADGFLIANWGSATLVRLDSDGRIRNFGQLKHPDGQLYAIESVNLTTNEWLLAAIGPFPQSFGHRLQFFRFSSKGEIRGAQYLDGYEFIRHTTDSRSPWTLKASDGRIRLVGNLTGSAENPHYGVAVAAFSVVSQVSSINFTQAMPTFANGGNNLVLQAGATGSGNLKYQWHYSGLVLGGQTNDTLTVTGPDALYNVRISDDQSEAMSPAVSVETESPRLDFKTDFYLGPGVSVPYGRKEFQIQSSTNLEHWAMHPTIYSLTGFIPISAVAISETNSTKRFFRTRTALAD